MKTRFSRILGIGLTVAVLASLLVAATPASAGYLSWTKDSGPTTVSGLDILDMAVAPNGTTGYVVTGNKDLDADKADTQIGGYKTTDGGKTFTKFIVATVATTDGAMKVAVAPDLADGSFVAVVVGDNQTYVSENGGTTFGKMVGSGAVMINDIAVSPIVDGGRQLAVVGTAASGPAIMYYVNVAGYGSESGWQSVVAWTNNDEDIVAGTTAGLAVQFSPNYNSDRTLVAVTTNGTATLNFFNIATKTGNSKYDSFNMTTQGIQIDASANPNTVALALPGSFMGWDVRTAYVAMNPGGLFRVGAASATRMTDTAMYSVALNAAGDKLVAGAASGNTVYRVASPAASPVTVNPSTKNPGWKTNNSVLVGFFGTAVGAATKGGTNSAFALSAADDGATFNDVALVNTTPTPVDFAVNADGTKMYLVTDDGAGVTSLWRKTTSWERVYKIESNNYMVRTAADNFDAVYLASKGAKTIRFSNDAGQTTWQPRVPYDTMQDLAVESVSVLYVLSPTGSVAKSVDGGISWTSKSTGAGGHGSMTLLAKDNLLVAGDVGVAYSTDGSSTWTAAGSGASAFPAKYAVADKLAAGGVITAASDTAIKSFTIGTDTAFSATALANPIYPVNGMVINGAVVYAMSSNATPIASKMHRSKVASAWTEFNVTDQQLVGIKAAGAKLYSMSVNSKAVYVFEDIAAAAAPAQTGPADKFVNPINMQTGGANNIVFQWTAIANTPTGAKYTLQISLNDTFTQTVKELSGLGTMAIVGPTAGSSESDNARFAFQADTTYYWRVRLSAIDANNVDSKWSTTRSFKTDTLAPLSLQAPASGTKDVSVNPTFVWSPAPGATTYELVVSDDPTFAIITFSRTSSQPVFASDEQLAYNTVYYWRVRASAPATAVTSWATGVFTTEAKPVPTTTAPSTTQPVTTTTFTIDVPPPTQAIPSYLLWIIIGIGAILVIALIVLIVRTRRVS